LLHIDQVQTLAGALDSTPDLIEEQGEGWGELDALTGPKEYVRCPGGLQPKPRASSGESSETLEMFRFLGRFVAKALMDGRLLDLPISPVMWKVALCKELSIEDISVFDDKLGATLKEMLLVAEEYNRIGLDDSQSEGERQARQEGLTFQGAQLPDLCLDFSLPGRPDIELKPGGAEIPVTVHNLGEYVQACVQCFLADGIGEQIDVFREGFDDIFPLEAIRIFDPEEVDQLVGGHRGFWDPQDFLDQVHAERGYTKESASIKNLAAILEEFDPLEKRLFLRFATGTPRLPADGLKGLSPPLTVGLKPPEPGTLPDDYLPSVMTCTNYLKLPDYSTKEVMREKLLMACREGHLSFHLS